MFEFLDVQSRREADRRHSSDNSAKPASLPSSRNNSTTSTSSRRSEPGWMTAMNGVDRSRASSVPAQPGTKPSGLSRLFGSKKEKKEHAGGARSKLAADPKHQPQRAVMVGTQNTLHVTAEQLEMRRPHSGPPSLRQPLAKSSDTLALTRIVSGDEADELDEWEQRRDEWRQRKMPAVNMQRVVEGEAVGGDNVPGTTTPEEKERGRTETIPSLSGLSLDGDPYEPRPERAHTPIGGRWKKDEQGVWRR